MITAYFHNPEDIEVEEGRASFAVLIFRDADLNNSNIFLSEAQWNSLVETVRIADKAFHSRKDAA